MHVCTTIYLYVETLPEADYDYYSPQATAPGWPSISIPSLSSSSTIDMNANEKTGGGALRQPCYHSGAVSQDELLVA